MPNKIDHVFVLMLENRSFDHLLGLSTIKGIVPPAAATHAPVPTQKGPLEYGNQAIFAPYTNRSGGQWLGWDVRAFMTGPTS